MRFFQIAAVAALCMVLLLSCGKPMQKKDVHLQSSSTTIAVPLNGPVGDSFGYEYIDDTAVIQPSAIAISDGFIFISDPKNNSIKKIDSITGKLVLAARPAERLARTYDMVIYNSKLICSSDTGVLMIYDLNLSFIKEIKLSSGWGEFYDVTDSYFEVYFPSENLKLYRMNSNYDVISSKSGYKSSKDAIHGKKLIVNEAGNEIETIYGRIRLPVPYGVLQYGGNNIEYSKNVVAYFSIDKPKNKLILNICTLEGQR